MLILPQKEKIPMSERELFVEEMKAKLLEEREVLLHKINSEESKFRDEAMISS